MADGYAHADGWELGRGGRMGGEIKKSGDRLPDDAKRRTIAIRPCLAVARNMRYDQIGSCRSQHGGYQGQLFQLARSDHFHQCVINNTPVTINLTCTPSPGTYLRATSVSSRE